MKRSFYYFNEDTLRSYSKNNQSPNTNTISTTTIEIIKQYTQDTFDGYIYEQGLKLSKNAYNTYSYFNDYRQKRKGYLTPDGLTYYRIKAFNFDENGYVIVSLQKEEPLKEDKEVVPIESKKPKTRKRKPVPMKIRAALQQEINSKCPLCDSEDVQQFEVHHIDGDKTNNDFINLIMVCPTCHSKIEKGNIPASKVKEIKLALSNRERKLTAMEIAELENNKIERAKVRESYLNSEEADRDANKEAIKLFAELDLRCSEMKSKYENIYFKYGKTKKGYLQISRNYVYILIQWYPVRLNSKNDLSITFNESGAFNREQKYKFKILQYKYDLNDSGITGWTRQGNFFKTEDLADFLLSELMKINKQYEKRFEN